MKQHHRDTELRGVLVDRGTNRRVPFAIWFDAETGEYEHYKPSPDGRDIQVDDDWKPIRVRGRAVGRLELVPHGQAVQIGYRPPEKVRQKEVDKEVGLEQYKRVFHEVWRWRGESTRCVGDRWAEFLKQSDFLDDFVLRRRHG